MADGGGAVAHGGGDGRGVLRTGGVAAPEGEPDDEVVELKELDAVRVPPEAERALEGGPEGIAYVAFGAPGGTDAPKDAEQLPGWWEG